jgi:hypothetical protein
MKGSAVRGQKLQASFWLCSIAFAPLKLTPKNAGHRSGVGQERFRAGAAKLRTASNWESMDLGGSWPTKASKWVSSVVPASSGRLVILGTSSQNYLHGKNDEIKEVSRSEVCATLSSPAFGKD